MSKFKSETWNKKQFPDLNSDHKFYEIVTESGETVCIVNVDYNHVADLIAAAPELAASAQGLVLEIGDTVLDEMRPVWGNSQVACITDKRNNLKLALLKAINLESKPVATAQPPAPVTSSNQPNAAPVETRFCAWHQSHRCFYWWDALWGNYNTGTGCIGMVPYGEHRDNARHRDNMKLIDPEACIILPFCTEYKVQDFQNHASKL